MTAFNGLPKDYFDFFRQLKANNNRAWFEDNRLRFRESVQEPLSAFVEAMGPRLKKISKHFVADPRLNGGSIFRIYRDVRFSKDKSPYKTHGGVQFRHALGRDAHAPGFYVHLDPDEIFYGGGVWAPAPPALMRIREAIGGQNDKWRKAISDKSFTARFGGVSGEKLSRPPRGFDPAHPQIEDIKRKSFFAMSPGAAAAARKASFTDEVAASFADARPLMKFLYEALGAPF